MDSMCSGRATGARIASVAAMMVLAAAYPAPADWGTYQGNAAHTGYVPGTLNLARARLQWKTPVGSSTLGGLAVGGNAVFVTNTAYGRRMALAGQTSAQLPQR